MIAGVKHNVLEFMNFNLKGNTVFTLVKTALCILNIGKCMVKTCFHLENIHLSIVAPGKYENFTAFDSRSEGA